MTAKPVRITYLADASEVVRASSTASSAMESAANQAKTSGDKIDAAFSSTASAADATASASSQAAGGIGDLGGALSLLPGPLGAVGAGMEAAAPAIMGVTGAADLLNLATQKIPGLQKVATISTNVLAAAKRGLGVATRFALGPIGLLIAAAALLVGGLVLAYNKSDTFRRIVDTAFAAVGKAAGTMWELIKGALGKIGDLLLNFTGPGLLVKHWDDVKEAGSAAFNGIKDVARTAFNSIATLWNSTVGKLSFTIPSWVPGLGGSGWNVPDIPMLAAGGIVTKPTLALIGEAGPEAVVPLSRWGGAGGVMRLLVELTAEQLHAIERGRRATLDIAAYQAAGGI